MNELPLAPSPQLLCKLGSIVGHVEELLSPKGHEFDRHALDALLRDPEVVTWMADMRSMALVPEPRTDKVPSTAELMGDPC